MGSQRVILTVLLLAASAGMAWPQQSRMPLRVAVAQLHQAQAQPLPTGVGQRLAQTSQENCRAACFAQTMTCRSGCGSIENYAARQLCLRRCDDAGAACQGRC